MQRVKKAHSDLLEKSWKTRCGQDVVILQITLWQENTKNIYYVSFRVIVSAAVGTLVLESRNSSMRLSQHSR